MSTVIKAGQAVTLVRRLSTLDLADHLREARAIVDDAREQALRIVADAEEQARRMMENAGERGRIEGFDKGHAEGVAAGRTAALEQSKAEFTEKHASLVEAFQSAISQMNETKEQLRLAAEKNLLDFAIMVASKVTFAVGELHRESALENFRRAITLVMDKTDVTVRCNAKDLETLRVFAEATLDSARSGQHVRLVEDDAVKPGGCVLRSGRAEVDATLDVQVAEMVSILVGRNSNA